MVDWTTFRPGKQARFEYTNHRGETETRNVIFESLDYGRNEWYPDYQWFLSGFCLDRQSRRSFALSKIKLEDKL